MSVKIKPPHIPIAFDPADQVRKQLEKFIPPLADGGFTPLAVLCVDAKQVINIVKLDMQFTQLMQLVNSAATCLIAEQIQKESGKPNIIIPH